MHSSLSHLIGKQTSAQNLSNAGYYQFKSGKLVNDVSELDEEQQELLDGYRKLLKNYKDVWMKPVLADHTECGCVETYWTLLLFIDENGIVKSADAYIRYMSSSPYWGVPDSEVTSSLHDAWMLSQRVIDIMEEDLA